MTDAELRQILSPEYRKAGHDAWKAQLYEEQCKDRAIAESHIREVIAQNFIGLDPAYSVYRVARVRAGSLAAERARRRALAIEAEERQRVRRSAAKNRISFRNVRFGLQDIL